MFNPAKKDDTRPVRWLDIIMLPVMLVVVGTWGYIVSPATKLSPYFLVTLGLAIAVALGLLVAWARHGKPVPAFVTAPISRSAGDLISNIAVVALLGVAALFFYSYLSRPNPPTASVIVAVAAGLVGGWLLKRRWTSTNLLPFAVSFVAVMVGHLGYSIFLR